MPDNAPFQYGRTGSVKASNIEALRVKKGRSLKVFGWFKKPNQRDREFMKMLITAAAEGESRAKVNRALGSEGIQLPSRVR